MSSSLQRCHFPLPTLPPPSIATAIAATTAVSADAADTTTASPTTLPPPAVISTDFSCFILTDLGLRQPRLEGDLCHVRLQSALSRESLPCPPPLDLLIFSPSPRLETRTAVELTLLTAPFLPMILLLLVMTMMMKSDMTLRKGGCKEVRFLGKTEKKDLKIKADTIKRMMDKGYRVKLIYMTSMMKRAAEKADIMEAQMTSLYKYDFETASTSTCDLKEVSEEVAKIKI